MSPIAITRPGHQELLERILDDPHADIEEREPVILTYPGTHDSPDPGDPSNLILLEYRKGPQRPSGTPLSWKRFDLRSDEQTADRFPQIFYRRHVKRLGEDVAYVAFQVLEELVKNAAEHAHKFDPEKRVHIRYGLFPDRVYFSVQNVGPGFDVVEQLRKKDMAHDPAVLPKISGVKRHGGIRLVRVWSYRVVADHDGHDFYTVIARDPPV